MIQVIDEQLNTVSSARTCIERAHAGCRQQHNGATAETSSHVYAAHLCKLCSLLVDLLIRKLLWDGAVSKLGVWVELTVPAWGIVSAHVSGQL
jgi:hypothetical protein